MKNSITLLIITLLTFQFTSCKTESKKEEKTIVKEVVVEQNNDDKDELDDDEIRDFGIVKKVEDGQYPMFIVTIEFPRSQHTVDFNINTTNLKQENLDLHALKGKSVHVTYTSNADNMLMDIHFNGKTLYGKHAPELDNSYKKITGVLSGADSESGDLTSTISITDKDGIKMDFKEFVTKEVMAKNGQQVTGYYYTKYSNTITKIKTSED